jgi:cation diffusion facilitator family transporter
MARQHETKKPIYWALAGNLLIALTKLAAAVFTGSSAMLSEAVHSLIDTGNEVLLLYGLHRASLPPDPANPLGHGRELYFWSFMVAVMIFALGAGISLYEGVAHILEPQPIRDVIVTYVVLALSFLFEGSSWLVAFRYFRRRKGRLGYMEAVRRSKDPTIFTVLFEDTAAIVGLAIAFAGILATQLRDQPAFDGIASIVIGLLLAATALFLARETKSLLIGEPASVRLQESILKIVAEDPAIQRANGVLTVHLAPEEVVVALSAEFKDHMQTPEVEASVERIEAALGAAHPEIRILFVKPQTAEKWRERRRRLEEAAKEGTPF